MPADPRNRNFRDKSELFYEGVLSALMDELGFDTLASPTNSPVIGPERSSQSFFVFSTEFGMTFKSGSFGCVMLPSSNSVRSRVPFGPF